MKELDHMYEEFTSYLKSVTPTHTKSTGNDKQKGFNEGKYNEIVSERLSGYVQTMYKYIRACLVSFSIFS